MTAENWEGDWTRRHSGRGLEVIYGGTRHVILLSATNMETRVCAGAPGFVRVRHAVQEGLQQRLWKLSANWVTESFL